ncbi:MAG: PIG-L family deacetylase [candidate division Zixibacteria bacterium]|nr:PIG-L family deacetylase [candidate division Zixibacteria bacterium]
MIDLKQYKCVLTFFAHPDDETLAAGATIHKLTNLGIEVHVAIPATGIHSRQNVQKEKQRDADLMELRRDCEKAMAVLGIPPSNIYLGDFPDNEMDKHSLLETIHWLEQILRKVKPDLVFTHHRYCTNIDHRYCHEALMVATRPGTDNHVTVLCGEVPSSTGYLKPVQWEPNCYIEVSESNVESKIKAMETYKGESRPDPHPRSREVLRALAKVRGSEAGFYFAEAFMISRAFA